MTKEQEGRSRKTLCFMEEIERKVNSMNGVCRRRRQHIPAKL